MAFTYSHTQGRRARAAWSSRCARATPAHPDEQHAPQVPGPIEPRCRYGQAWKAAVGAGLPATAEHEAIYGVNGRATWVFEVKGARVAEVDGQTCAVIRGR